MCRQVKFGRSLIFATMSLFFCGVPAWASDLSESLWGGRGSRTTVSDPYIPPPLVTDTSIPVASTPGLATTQSNLMLGTPGAMTLPPGGVTASNGVATSSVSSGAYVIPAQFTTASNIIPAVQVAPQQPFIEYGWTYSTIKDTTYEPVTVYDPRLGSYVTTMQERQTESVLPWLHRKQVIRYKLATTDTITGSPTVGGTTSPPISDPAGKYIVNRLFPVSTVPSPPAQAVPVQTLIQTPVQTFPLYDGPATTYAAESTPGTRIVASSDLADIQPTLLPNESTVKRIDTEIPVITTIAPDPTSPFNLAPQPYSTTTSSQPVDMPSPDIISPSAHQVLYQTIPAVGVSASAINTTGGTSGSKAPDTTPTDTPSTQPAPPPAPTTPATQTPASPQTGTQANQPTLAPERSTQTPTTQETVQRPTIQDSLTDSERSQPVVLPPGETLPPPAQSSPIPSITPPSTGSDKVPLLKTPTTRPDLSNSPTRMPPRTSPLSN